MENLDSILIPRVSILKSTRRRYLTARERNFTLAATNALNATYNWTIVSGGGPTSTSGNSATFNITTNVNETIQVEIVQGWMYDDRTE